MCYNTQVVNRALNMNGDIFMLTSNPLTGDAGLSPIIIVLIIVCTAIIVGCIIWTILLNRKNNKIVTTVVTVTDEDETEPEQTVLEDIPTEPAQDDDLI